MKVMITGEVGMTARSLERYFGDEVVWGYERRDLSICHFDSIWEKNKELDINSEEFQETVGFLQPDVIIHTAGAVGTDLCQLNPKMAVKSNVDGAIKVAEAVKGIGARLVFFSTTAIYDPDDYRKGLINDLTKKGPRTIYGLTKYLGEIMTKEIVSPNKLLIIRPCFMYGGDLDNHSGLVKYVRAVKNNKKDVFLMDPENYKDYINIEDAVEIIGALTRKKVCGEYNISKGTPQKLKWYEDRVTEALGKRPDIEYLPKEDYLHNHLVDGSAAIRESGYTPKVEWDALTIKRIYGVIK